MNLTDELRQEYLALFGSIVMTQAQRSTASWYIARILGGKARYQSVSESTGVPWYVIAVIHALEGSCDFGTHLHNGDPLWARTTHTPAGRPVSGVPPFTWEYSAIDALQYDGAASVESWDIARTLFFLEGFNGWGYRTGAGRNTTPPMRSPYLWSLTQYYERGKYTKDGVFSPTAVSGQAGAATLLFRLREMGGIPEWVETANPTPRPDHTPDDVGWFNAYVLQKPDGGLEMGVAAKIANSDQTFATLRIPIEPGHLEGFLGRFPRASSIVNAEPTKPWPGDFAEPLPAPPALSLLERIADIATGEAKQDISWRGNGKAKKYTKKFEPIFGTGRFAWCMAFGIYCVEQATGETLPIHIPGDPNKYTWALVEAVEQWARRNGKWVANNGDITAQRGWICQLDYEGDGWDDHTGVVLEDRGDYVLLAEGNYNDHTALVKRRKGLIAGYVNWMA